MPVSLSKGGSTMDFLLHKFRFIRLSIVAMLIVMTAPALPAGSAPNRAINFVVNSNGDQPDLVSNDGLCETANNNCTLRAAMEEANTSQAGYVINFASNMTITPGSPLPAIVSDNVTISGIGRNIVIDGSQAGIAKSGIWIKGASNNVIQRLTIQDWDRSGILIDGSSSAAQNNLIGTNGDGNDDADERVVVRDNFSYGVEITGAFAVNNVVAGNNIGSTAQPNQTGVAIRIGAHGNLVGTDGDGIADAAERNLIRGNSNLGVGLYDADSNTIAGNYIGLDGNGSTSAGNGGGIFVGGGSRFNLIGTNGDGIGDAEERNVISASTSSPGVRIDASIGNTVAGNYIGTNASGSSARGNSFGGVELANGADGNIIGTNGDGVGDDHEGNVVSGNGGAQGFSRGIILIAVQRNIVAGNFVGTDASGTTAIGNVGVGIGLAAGSQTNVVGTDNNGVSDMLEGNLVSGNSGDGIGIVGSQNIISGNKIGTDSSGALNLGNGYAGIQILSIGNVVSSNNIIGGLSPVQSNVIAFNDSPGILVTNVSGNPSEFNAILTNSIFSNGGRGIDLSKSGGFPDDVTPNDSKDLDHGANELMNFPEVTTAVSVGSKTYAVAQISNGLHNSNQRLQFYASPDCDPSGYGEGKTFLGQVSVSTDSNGDATSGMVEFNVATSRGEVITATASNHILGPRSTSEFSACKVVERNLKLVPACSVKDKVFAIQESPFQTAALIGLTLSVFVGAGLGLGALLEGRLGWGSQVMARRLGGAISGVVGVVALGFLSQVPSCTPPIPMDLPGQSSSITSSFPVSTPEATGSPTPTATETTTPTASPSPTEEEECTYTALVNLFCRSGPGPGYPELDTFIPGLSAPVVGQSTDGFYWYVIGPYNGHVCTVPEGPQYGDVSGACGQLPAFTPIPVPPTETPTSTPTCDPGIAGC